MATESPMRIMEPSLKFQEKQRNSGPNRSGSAPPSMEGSFAAIENLISRHKIAANASPNEERIRADPSYLGYYSTHVNLNPRLPPPLISDENRLRFNVTSTGNDPRFTSKDDFTPLTQSNLSTHKEESDDDHLTKQENLLQDPSPVQNQFRHESTDEADNHDGHNTRHILYSEDDVSSITNGMLAINTSTIPNTESQSQSQRDQRQRSMFQINELHPQIVSHGQSQTYIGMNQFLQSQRVMHPYASGSGYMMSGNNVYPNTYFPQQYTLGGYTYNPPYLSGYLPNTPVHMLFDVNSSPNYIGQSQSQTSGVNLQYLNKFYDHPGLPIQPPFAQKQESLGIMSHGNLNFGSPTNPGILQFPNAMYAASPPVPGSPIGGVGLPSGRNGMRAYGGWQTRSGNQVFKDPKTYSFLEELKSGKGRRLELSDIFGHIIEFCGDQHGSRFIQQKLEICSIEEKESVFKEVLPNASSLIIDVFGNYVIQKFFEYGSGEQRRELANQLEGQILPLSLQMYGCRVIQKALDVIEVEQKIKLVGELDGHVLRCVRDQNGNHVIQKCIESIPMEKIKFVIASFRGQVAALSTHPYGCRVIQRVLEHSTDELQSQFIVDEILESVYNLAQDQYGNYVTQHVLKRGKPEERSQIVHKLAGHVVQLSQHKFASNVIEKCLEYGDSSARGVFIEEIVGLGEDSDNLLAMVKDQFANYVIQKVLQICTSDQREVLLGRIKIHLNSLKKYTYGKHIVTRFEQLYGEEIQTFGS